MKVRRTILFGFTALILGTALLITACFSPLYQDTSQDSLEDDAYGSVTVRLHVISPRLLDSFAAATSDPAGASATDGGTVTPSAYLFANSVTLQLKQGGSSVGDPVEVTDVGAFGDGLSFLAHEFTSLPRGDGYTIYAEVFNTAQPGGEPTVLGESAPFAVTPEHTEVTVDVLPANATAVESASPTDVNIEETILDADGNIQQSGGEAWFEFTPTSSGPVRIVATPSADTFAYMNLSDESNNWIADTNEVETPGYYGLGTPVAIEGEADAGTTYYVGVILVSESGALDPNPQGSFEWYYATTVTGHVYDGDTGAPVAGATYRIGDYAALTGTDGAFSLAVPESETTISGDQYVYKGTEYDFLVIPNRTIAVTPDPQLVFYLDPYDAPAFQPVDIEVMDISGNELTSDTGVRLIIQNSAGGRYEIERPYGEFPLPDELPTFGGSCSVALFVLNGDGATTDWYYYETGVDTSSGLSLTVSESAVAGQSKTVYIDGAAVSAVPYAFLQQAGSGFQFGSWGVASGSGVQIYDPDNDDQFLWARLNIVTDGTAETNILASKSATQGVTDNQTVTLPPTGDLSFTYPGGAADSSSATWDAGIGTLSFTAVADAAGYRVKFEDNNCFLGMVFGAPDSFTFNADFVARVLDQGAGWDLNIEPFSSTTLTVDDLVYSQMRGPELHRLDYWMMLPPGQNFAFVEESDFAASWAEDVF